MPHNYSWACELIRRRWGRRGFVYLSVNVLPHYFALEFLHSSRDPGFRAALAMQRTIVHHAIARYMRS